MDHAVYTPPHSQHTTAPESLVIPVQPTTALAVFARTSLDVGNAVISPGQSPAWRSLTVLSRTATTVHARTIQAS
jgi:hypothetical protein